MTKFQIVEEGSCMTLAVLTSLEDALRVLEHMTKTYYIYQQSEFSAVSCGVWRCGQKIASEKYW